MKTKFNDKALSVITFSALIFLSFVLIICSDLFVGTSLHAILWMLKPHPDVANSFWSYDLACWFIAVFSVLHILCSLIITFSIVKIRACINTNFAEKRLAVWIRVLYIIGNIIFILSAFLLAYITLVLSIIFFTINVYLLIYSVIYLVCTVGIAGCAVKLNKKNKDDNDGAQTEEQGKALYILGIAILALIMILGAILPRLLYVCGFLP